MRFRMLGPLRVCDGANWAPIRAGQQRVVLAVLLIEAGRVVSTDRLVEEIWGDHPPRAAMVTVQGYVRRLRQVLGGGSDGPLLTRGRGYELVVEDGDLDATMFERLVGSGSRGLADGDPGTAIARLSEALELWRGRPLADVPSSPTVAAESARLEQSRLDAIEKRLGAMLDLGRHAEVVEELHRVVDEHPLRERLRGQLMLALYRCGRRAEALEAYQHARRMLMDELGTEPGGELRELQRAILIDDPRLSAPARPGPPAVGVTPAQLPAKVAGFTGRDAPVDQLDALLPSRSDPHPVLVISTIAGTAGVGKTALAVHWAHRVRHRFPDGQLYVNLRGYAAGPPLRPIDALAAFLPALGVPAEQVPVEAEQAATLYRSMLADKRVLVLLDNANHPDQVRPLLPGTPGCLVLVTSRDQLGGLLARDGAVRLTLDALTPAESRTLLARQLGADRVRAEPEAAAELARLCGQLPLALRIAVANLIAHPTTSIADYAARLATGDRLTALQVDDDPQAAVRAAFGYSYAALPGDTRRLFRLLGLIPGPDATAEAAAALAGIPAGQAARLLDGLAVAHLIDEHVADRYAFHDLLRRYAAEQATTEDSDPDRRAALERLLGYYLHTVDAAARLLYPEKLRLPLPAPAKPEPAAPPFDDQASTIAWLDAERLNLVAAVLHAAEHGPHPVAWQLADALRGYFDLRMHTVNWLAAANAALAAATAAGEVPAQAAAHLSLATLHAGQSQSPQAIDHFTQALILSRRTGWRDGHAAAHGNLGVVYQELGQLRQAATHYTEALEIHPQTSYRGGTANGLGNLGQVYHLLGRLEDALSTLTKALALKREVGTRGGEAEILHALAAVHRDAGHRAEALDLATAAVALAREVGDLRCEADARNALATVHHQLSRHQQAMDGHQQALDLAREIGNRYTETEALTGLAATHQQAGHPGRSIDYAHDALTIASQAGFRVLEGQALTALAAAHLQQNRPDKAFDLAEQAIANHIETGHRLGLARSHLVAGRALHRMVAGLRVPGRSEGGPGSALV